MHIPKGSLLFAASALLLAGCSEATETRAEKGTTQGGSATQTGAEGTLRVPADYRDTYQYLGTWAVAADGTPGSKELHIVYASPGAAAGHRATGTFADGTTLGSRLNHSQNATAAARLTADRKFLASLSYRVAMRRKSLRRQNMASTRQRSL